MELDRLSYHQLHKYREDENREEERAAHREAEEENEDRQNEDDALEDKINILREIEEELQDFLADDRKKK